MALAEPEQRRDDRLSRLPGPKTTITVLTLWALAMLWLAVSAGAQHDYELYLGQWQLVLDGGNPWSTDNAYGPLHNLLAYLLPLDRLAPKLMMVTALVAVALLLARELWRIAGPGSFAPYLIALTTNIIVIGMGAIYGINDTLCAAFVGAAVLARLRGASVLCGVMLGAAVLLKYYPALLVPFFALDARRIVGRLIAAAVVSTAIGLALGYLRWGGSIFDPVLFGIEREPKLLSIFAALQHLPWLAGGTENLRVLLRANGVLVLLAAAATLGLAYFAKLRWIEGAVLGLLAVLTAYKVGHQQFYMPWLMLVAALPLSGSPIGRRIAYVCLPFALFVSLYQWGYQFATGMYRGDTQFIRDYGGFVAFLLAMATLIVAFWLAFRGKPEAA